MDEETKAEGELLLTGKTIQCAETFLSAARSTGLVIPSGCTFGVCGTCKVRKTEGEVQMVHNGGIADEDIADDYILACGSNPLGSLKIEA